MPSQPEQPDSSMIADGWRVAPDATAPTPRRSIRRRVAGLSAVVVLSLGLFGVGSLLSGGNTASAMAGHPEVLREGCTWDSSGNYVQNCKVWSESQNKFVTVQIRASNGSDQGIYLLDGMRAQEDRSAWTNDVQAAQVYDGSTDPTLVMPVGGASSFVSDAVPVLASAFLFLTARDAEGAAKMKSNCPLDILSRRESTTSSDIHASEDEEPSKITSSHCSSTS